MANNKTELSVSTDVLEKMAELAAKEVEGVAGLSRRSIDLKGIMKNIDKDGTVLNVSGGTGMGMNAEHYKNILIAPMAYGQSLTILALAEALLHL